MKQLLTIEEVARETGLEESLLRFYESEYPTSLPRKVLQGDALLFDPGAVAAFRNLHRRHTGADGGETRPPSAGLRFARVIAVTSGKGGVGKTSLALSLAVELQRLGKMCVLLDADMGLANVHLLAGLDPVRDVTALLSGQTRLADLIMSGPEGVGIVPGGAGILALADGTREERHRIVRALEEVEKAADIIVVDTGAGMGASVRDFLGVADELLFVLTPDITSLADAYGLLKALCREDPGLAGRPVLSVVNMVDTLQQAVDMARRFSECARRFLEVEVRNVGYILRDSTVAAAVARRTPYCVFRPQARVSKNTRQVAVALLRDEIPELRRSSAFGRYMRLLREEKR